MSTPPDTMGFDVFCTQERQSNSRVLCHAPRRAGVYIPTTGIRPRLDATTMTPGSECVRRRLQFLDSDSDDTQSSQDEMAVDSRRSSRSWTSKLMDSSRDDSGVFSEKSSPAIPIKTRGRMRSRGRRSSPKASSPPLSNLNIDKIMNFRFRQLSSAESSADELEVEVKQRAGRRKVSKSKVPSTLSVKKNLPTKRLLPGNGFIDTPSPICKRRKMVTLTTPKGPGRGRQKRKQPSSSLDDSFVCKVARSGEVEEVPNDSKSTTSNNSKALPDSLSRIRTRRSEITSCSVGPEEFGLIVVPEPSCDGRPNTCSTYAADQMRIATKMEYWQSQHNIATTYHCTRLECPESGIDSHSEANESVLTDISAGKEDEDFERLTSMFSAGM